VHYGVRPVIYDVREERELLFYATGAFGTKKFRWALVLLGAMENCIHKDFKPEKRPIYCCINFMYNQQSEGCSEDPPR
jgi:hypothetical protein